MSELISGKEAYKLIGEGILVLANVQQSDKSMKWEDASQLPACDILNDGFDFKIQPKTISINGIEVPAPFEPKEGDVYYFINSSNLKGYALNKFANDGDDECLTFYGTWRTEDEIKQVVAAIRSIFKGE